MADDEDEDLYDEEFDFVDDDDEVADEEEEASADDSDLADEPDGERAADEAEEPDDSEEPVDEYGRPEPAPNYVVHVYESRKFKRTIDRPFTPEDAEAFATEFNRTAKNYNRIAVTGKNDAKPKKALD
jgi:hypothetical protein